MENWYKYLPYTIFRHSLVIMFNVNHALGLSRTVSDVAGFKPQHLSVVKVDNRPEQLKVLILHFLFYVFTVFFS